METPLISVIVPVYNAQEYLAECIESILVQTLTAFELILVDDASTDKTSSICRDYASGDSRIKFIQLEKNEGQANARNVGLDAAVGRRICFVDSDDCIHPQALRRMSDVMDSSGVLMVAAEAINATSVEFKPFESDRVAYDVIGFEKAMKLFFYQKKKYWASVCSKLYDCSLFDDSLRFHKGLYYEDLEIFPHLMRRDGHIASFNDVIYFYRVNPGSFINTWSDKRLDVLHVTALMEDDVRRHFPHILPAAADRRFSANFNIFILASAAGRKDVAQSCWKVIKHYRRRCLADSSARMKNKMGALLSYLGQGCVLFVARLLNLH